MSPIVTIPYHSGYGHTKKVAESVARGAQDAGAQAAICDVTQISSEQWELLDTSNAIVFGAPTYMGSVSAEYKRFMDDTSERWVGQQWKDKVAGGFTNSGAFCGDKLSALMQLNIFAMQHSMIWVGTGIKSSSGDKEPSAADINRLGSFLGVMTYATNESADITPPTGDLETARLYGERIVAITKSFT